MGSKKYIHTIKDDSTMKGLAELWVSFTMEKIKERSSSSLKFSVETKPNKNGLFTSHVSIKGLPFKSIQSEMKKACAPFNGHFKKTKQGSCLKLN